MSTAGKRRGAQFETDVLRWIRSQAGLPAERLRLAGKDDEGDIAVQDVGLTYLLELKATQKLDLAGAVAEVMTERVNYAKARGLDPATVMPLVVFKRRNHGIAKAYVVTTVEEFFAP